MKKWMISIVILAILGYAGYKVGMNYVSQKMMDKVTEQVLGKEEIAKMMQDPVIQQTIQEQIGDQGLERIQQHAEMSGPQAPNSNKTNTTGTSTDSTASSEKSKLAFASKEEALSFLLSKFSMKELQGFAAKAQGGLTSEEKADIQSQLLSRISPDEFQALKVLGLIEMSKSKE